MYVYVYMCANNLTIKWPIPLKRLSLALLSQPSSLSNGRRNEIKDSRDIPGAYILQSESWIAAR